MAQAGEHGARFGGIDLCHPSAHTGCIGVITLLTPRQAATEEIWHVIMRADYVHTKSLRRQHGSDKPEAQFRIVILGVRERGEDVSSLQIFVTNSVALQEYIVTCVYVLRWLVSRYYLPLDVILPISGKLPALDSPMTAPDNQIQNRQRSIAAFLGSRLMRTSYSVGRASRLE